MALKDWKLVHTNVWQNKKINQEIVLKKDVGTSWITTFYNIYNNDYSYYPSVNHNRIYDDSHIETEKTSIKSYKKSLKFAKSYMRTH